MINVLSAKRLTENPADGIDNFTRAVFGRMTDDRLRFHAEMEGSQADAGALRRLAAARMDFLRHERPDFLWGIGRMNELPLLLRRPKATRYLINFHTLLYKKSVGAWSVRTPWFVRKFIFNQAAMILCPSEFSAASVRRYFPKKNVVSILNGVDLNLFRPNQEHAAAVLREKYQIEIRPERPIIAFVGALQVRKRPEVFIELAGKFPGAQFVAVGRRDPAHDVLGRAHGLANFQWAERMPREDVAALLSVSKAFVFPSLNEPAAAVILEAMASGCVPILSKSGGNGEFLEGGDGFLVSPDENELDSFTDVVRSFLGNSAAMETMSRAARRTAERHSWDMVAREYEKNILSL